MLSGDPIRGHVDSMILAALAEGPTHGYGLVLRLRELSGGAFDLKEGTLYPALHRLERAGKLESTRSRDTGRERRVYALTPSPGPRWARSGRPGTHSRVGCGACSAAPHDVARRRRVPRRTGAPPQRRRDPPRARARGGRGPPRRPRARGEHRGPRSRRSRGRRGRPLRLAAAAGLGCAPERRVPLALRAALAVGALALTGGFAYAQLRAAAPVVALTSSVPRTAPASPGGSTVGALGRSRLVALDPVTLRVRRVGPTISAQVTRFGLAPEAGFVSPDGATLALASGAAVHFYDLQTLRPIATTAVGKRPPVGSRAIRRIGGTDFVRAGAWLDGAVVAFVQRMSAPYARRVVRREVVIVDPATKHVLRRDRVAVRGMIAAATSNASHLVLLVCRPGHATVLGIQGGEEQTTLDAGVPCPEVLPQAALALDGYRLALVLAAGRLVTIDLATPTVHHVRLRTVPAWSRVRVPLLRAIWWRGRVLVTGSSGLARTVIVRPASRTAVAPSPVPIVAPVPARARDARPIAIDPRSGTVVTSGVGVTAIDPRTGDIDVLDRRAAWLIATPDRLVVGTPSLGVSAYDAHGRRIWDHRGAEVDGGVRYRPDRLRTALA